MLCAIARPAGLLATAAPLLALALATAAQDRPAGEVKVEKASETKGALRPIEVRLDFQDRTLAEIVAGINAQGPKMLAIDDVAMHYAEISPLRRFTVRAPGPLTFWEAVDRVAAATETRPVGGRGSVGGPCIGLVPASRDRGFVCHDGAFRIAVTGTSYERTIQLAPLIPSERPVPGAYRPRDKTYLAVHLAVRSEPRLTILFYQDLVIREATDERGRSLIPVVPWRLSLKDSWNHPPKEPRLPDVGFVPDGGEISIPLELLDEPARRIKGLKGSISVGVASGRTPEASLTPVELSFDFADIPLP
jgi:hypothetical protein